MMWTIFCEMQTTHSNQAEGKKSYYINENESILTQQEYELDRVQYYTLSNLLKFPNIGCPRNELRAGGINRHLFY